MHYLSSVYYVTVPLRVSGLIVANHQEVAMYICNKWYVLYVLVDCQLACLTNQASDSQIKRTTRTIFCIYTLLPRDDGLLASPKHVEV
jgi:hypothetical protein